MTSTMLDAYPLTAFQVAAVVAGVTGELSVHLPAPDPGRPGDVAQIAEAARRAVLAELAALFPPLRTRLALAEGSFQQVTGDLTAEVGVEAAPDGSATVTVRLCAPVLDPPSADLVADEARRRFHAHLAGQAPRVGRARPDTRDAVAGLPKAVPGSPGDLALPEVDAGSHGQWELPVEPLRRVAADLAVPVATVLLAVHLRTLGALTGRARVRTWVVEDGRARAGAPPDAAGEFRVLTGIAVDRDAATWVELVRRVDRALAAAPPGGHRPERGELAGPVFEHRPGAASGYAQPPLAPLHVTVIGDTVHVAGDVVAGRRVLDHWRQAVAELTADTGADPRPAAPVDPVAAHPRGGPPAGDASSVTALLREWSERTPDATAIVDADGELTFGQMRERVDRLRHALRAAGIRPGDTVGVHLPRSARLVTTLFALLQAGATVIALDVDHPAQRSARTLVDAGATALLTTGAAPGPKFAGPVLDLDGLGVEAVDDATPLPPPHPATPAYIQFTSGSTGRPKGAVIPHAALGNLVRWTADALGVGPGDRVAQRTATAFDAAVWELFAPIACGATLVVLPSEASREVAVLAAALERHRITVLQLVPSLLAVHLEAATFRAAGSLRLVLCGGEALPQALATAFAEQSRAALVNVYGPSECTVDTAWWTADPRAPGATVPIGTAVPGVQLYVLDELDGPVLAGLPGELCIGGAQVGQGYRGRPGATADAFRPDPYTGPAGARLYRTGDRVRRLAGGQLEYLGRLDRQVKIRGVRVELAEVEAVLTSLPEVGDGAVTTVADHTGAAELVALVVPARGGLDPAALRDAMARLLPPPMIPARFVALPALPRLPHGKTDHDALRAAAAADRPDYRPPADPVQRQLSRIWAQLLGLDAVGTDDDLDRLGRTPLLARRAAARLAADGGPVVPAALFVSAPTVARLADSLAKETP